jgi:hypothetical protein
MVLALVAMLAAWATVVVEPGFDAAGGVSINPDSSRG